MDWDSLSVPDLSQSHRCPTGHGSLLEGQPPQEALFSTSTESEENDSELRFDWEAWRKGWEEALRDPEEERQAW